MTTVTLGVDLALINCGECGGSYAINERYRLKKQQTGGSWHCPYCEVSWGYAEGENARLKKQLAQAQHNADQTQARLRQEAAHAQRLADVAERRRAAMKGQVTRIKNHVSKGVCPCCMRHFANLQRHMEGQHPGYANSETPSTESAVS